MKEIKFRQKLNKKSSTITGDSFHYWGYIGREFHGPVGKINSIAPSEQYTGIKDRNGVEIFEGDLINIFYESAEFAFDGVYLVVITEEGVDFQFQKLLWDSFGYNQYPVKRSMLTWDGFIRADYKNQSKDYRLCVAEDGKYRYSNYFEIIGNIHENAELLAK